MYGAVAATEVAYYASKSLRQMRCVASKRQQAPRRCGAIQPSGRVLLLCLLRNRQRTESDERRRDSMVRLVFCLWLAVSGFALSQRQATSKGSIGIFCPLSACFLGWKKCTYDVFTRTPAAALRKIVVVYQLAAAVNVIWCVCGGLRCAAVQRGRRLTSCSPVWRSSS